MAPQGTHHHFCWGHGVRTTARRNYLCKDVTCVLGQQYVIIKKVSISGSEGNPGGRIHKRPLGGVVRGGGEQDLDRDTGENMGSLT